MYISICNVLLLIFFSVLRLESEWTPVSAGMGPVNAVTSHSLIQTILLSFYAC